LRGEIVEQFKKEGLAEKEKIPTYLAANRVAEKRFLGA